MSQKNLALILIASLLFGSSVSLIITKFLIEYFNLNFLSFEMPGVDKRLAFEKTFDILDFFIAGILSLGFFILNWFGKNLINKFFKKNDFSYASRLLLFFSFVTFIQTHFVIYSSKQVLLMVVFFEIVFFFSAIIGANFLSKINYLEKFKTPQGILRFQNGIFLGFFLTLLTNNLTTIPALSLMFLFLTPFLTVASSNPKVNQFLENFPGFLFFLSLFFPNDLTKLLLLGGLAVVLTIVSLRFELKNVSLKAARFINPVLIIFLLIYNPNFFIGNFDTIEEGFLLAWVQRLINGESLYKDVFVYHPPLIPWGMYLFSKIQGFNLYSERLFLHLLQVAGGIIYFFLVKKIIKNIWVTAFCFFVFLGITSSTVRNNVEIRVALPLLSLLCFYHFFEAKKWFWLFISGLLSGVSILLSFETGLVSLLVLPLALNLFSGSKFFSRVRLKENMQFFAGVILILAPFFIYLNLVGALDGFLEQTYFYAGAFSKGYFNSSLERSVSHSYFHFSVFDEYLDSVTIFWETSKLTFIGFMIFGLYKFFAKLQFSKEEISVSTLALFGLILTRSSLGRSDFSHLLFVSVIAILLIFYSLSKLLKTNKILSIILMFFIVIVMGRPWISNAFLEQALFKFETYGKVFGEYKNYNFERGQGALIGMEIDTQPVFELVKYIESNSTKDDKIFVYPWNPEIYFYTDRVGATQIDTPYAFFKPSFQSLMVKQLENSNPKFIVYNPEMKFGNLTPQALKQVDDYINLEYKSERIFGPYHILIKGKD